MLQAGMKTWVEISKAAIQNNIAALRTFLSPESIFCAVIKANAYGHGQKEMTEVVLQCGVDHFAVDSIEEAVELRQDAPSATIFILGYTVPERLVDVVKIDAIQTVYSRESIEKLAAAARNAGTIARVSVKIETGLHRQGVGPRGLIEILDSCKCANDSIELVGLSSHFANAEEPSSAMNAFQLENFRHAADAVRADGFNPTYLHIACSAAAMIDKDAQLTLSRFGLALYGLWSSKNHRRNIVLGGQNIELTPALAWKTRIAQVKDVAPGSAIGYGGTHITNRPIRLAVLPVGYADGYDRALSNRGEVLVRGRRCPIVGNVCMNMFMVDVSAVPAVQADDEVTLIGRDGMHVIDAGDIATLAGTINYEVIARISSRIPRILW